MGGPPVVFRAYEYNKLLVGMSILLSFPISRAHSSFFPLLVHPGLGAFAITVDNGLLGAANRPRMKWCSRPTFAPAALQRPLLDRCFSSYASWATSSANSSEQRAIRKGPASKDRNPRRGSAQRQSLCCSNRPAVHKAGSFAFAPGLEDVKKHFARHGVESGASFPEFGCRFRLVILTA
jgi:hypothetical protein